MSVLDTYLLHRNDAIHDLPFLTLDLVLPQDQPDNLPVPLLEKVFSLDSVVVHEKLLFLHKPAIQDQFFLDGLLHPLLFLALDPLLFELQLFLPSLRMRSTCLRRNRLWRK